MSTSGHSSGLHSSGLYSSNGLAPPSRSWKQLSIARRSPSYCRVTFDHPPINTNSTAAVAELAELVGLIEQDADLNVVVFDSVKQDVVSGADDGRNAPAGAAAFDRPPSGLPAWIEVLDRLSRAPVVSIASIRGRVRGAGTEFVLACDLRFASRENTLLGLPEVGVAMGGGPVARLAQQVGRGRALEMLLVGDDLDGPRAEQYGYVNRLIAGDRLDAEVDAIAGRLARLDHDVIARTKSYLYRVAPVADRDPPPAHPHTAAE